MRERLALKTYAVAAGGGGGGGGGVRPDLGARRQDARGAAEGFTRSFSGQARCSGNKKNAAPKKNGRPWRHLSDETGRRQRTGGGTGAPALRSERRRRGRSVPT